MMTRATRAGSTSCAPGSRRCSRSPGRIKELLITGGGENVAPVPIEDALKEALRRSAARS